MNTVSFEETILISVYNWGKTVILDTFRHEARRIINVERSASHAIFGIAVVIPFAPSDTVRGRFLGAHMGFAVFFRWRHQQDFLRFPVSVPRHERARVCTRATLHKMPCSRVNCVPEHVPA